MSQLELIAELRAARVTASPELRERVRAIAAAAEPQPARFRLPSLSLRRTALLLAPAAVAVAVGGAVVAGLVSSGSSTKRAEPQKLAAVQTVQHGEAARASGIPGVIAK